MDGRDASDDIESVASVRTGSSCGGYFGRDRVDEPTMRRAR